MDVGSLLILAIVAAVLFVVVRATRKGRRGGRFWRVYYRGQVSSLGSGSATTEFALHNHMDIGGVRLRNVMVSNRMGDALTEAMDNADDAIVALGWFVNRRWALLVKTGEYVERESLIRLLIFSVVGLPLAFAIVAIIGALIVEALLEIPWASVVVMLGLVLLCLLQLAANFWAWLGVRA